MKSLFCGAVLVSACAIGAGTVSAQRAEPLQLSVLQREALEHDARGKELELLGTQSALRARNLEVERLPSISVLGLAQYQSDVPQPPPLVPGGQPLFSPSKDVYDTSVRVEQRIIDPSSSPRRALARADLAESQARVRTTLYSLRSEVNESFFAAALLQEQLNALAATLADLEARLRETNARVREGAALAGESAAIEATLLSQRQRADELRAARAVALARLAALSGRPIGDETAMSIPELGDAVAEARVGLDRVRARPEYEQFDRARERASRQQEVASAGERPQLSAFGRAGYGKPGLNFISDQFQTYALGGVQLQWKAWTWGTSGREREALALQQSIVTAEETAFTEAMRRAIQQDLATIEWLQSARATDDRIVELRDSIQRAARLRLTEGVITASDYIDRETERLAAEFDRARHRVELAQARTRVLTTLGLEVK